MADLTITAANVVPGLSSRLEQGFAGETITAGMLVYKSTDGKWYKADNNSGTALARVPTAIALTGSSANQPIVVQRSGSLVIGATLTAGLAYYLSATAGAICPVGDLTTGMYPALVGIATSTSVLKLSFNDSGVAL